MTTFDVLDRFGTAGLIRFVVALVLFVVLHLLRLPLVIVARVIEVCMQRIDAYATGQATHTADPAPRTRSRPHTDWFAKEATHHAHPA